MTQEPGRQIVSTVFATGEAATAELAFERAHEVLWNRLGLLADLELVAVQHETATRTVSEKSLNLTEWTTDVVGEISTVIVSLLATCKYTAQQDGSPSDTGKEQ